MMKREQRRPSARDTGESETEGFRKAAAGIRKSEDRRPKTHRESVVVAPTDGRTDERPRKQRISSSVYCVLQLSVHRLVGR